MISPELWMMISPLIEDARERYGYIYAKEKIFFDFTKFSRGIFSKVWTERGIFCGGCLAGMCGTLGCKGLGLGRICLKKTVLLRSARKNVVNLQDNCALSLKVNARISRNETAHPQRVALTLDL